MSRGYARLRGIVAGLLGLLLIAAIPTAVATPQVAAPATPQVEDGFSFAAGGDLIGPNQALDLRQKPDPALKAVAKHFRQADMGFANVEGSLFNLSTFKGWPAAETGGGYPLGPAVVAKNLRSLGITMVSKANNHGTDFGTLGLVATLRSLKAAGIVEGGAGMNLAQARAPAYLQTPKGKVALVDTASTFTPMSVAGSPDPGRFGRYAHGRPGISVIHVRKVHLLPLAQFDKLRSLVGGIGEVSRRQAWSGEPPGVPAAHGSDLVVGNTVFRGALKRGLTWEMNSKDVKAVISSIKQARRHANFVLFSIHSHEITPYPNSPAYST
ncbi:MAG: CapA family protein, partial [Steroidobacteraceae bacterium]